MRLYQYLALCLICLCALGERTARAAPPQIRMTCHNPQGTEISYGPGLLGIRDRSVDTHAMDWPGMQLTIVIQAEQPQLMRVTWDPAPEVSGTERGPAATYDATVVATTDNQITAVQLRAQGVWMYSVFPKLGIGYVSSHNHVPFGSTGRSLALYATCRLTAP